MVVRTIAVILSVFLHGLVGFVMWPRLVTERLEVLDLGKGPDIILTPQGIVASEVTNLGDDVQTIETQDVVPVMQERTAPTPTVKPTEQLRDVIGEAESKKTAEVVPIQEQRPKSERPIPAPAEQLPAVIDSEESSIEQEASKEPRPPPDQIHEPKIVEADEPSPPSDLKEPNVINADEAPAPSPVNEPAVAKADVPAAPDQLEESTVSKADLPPPDQLKESTIAEANEPLPKRIEEPKPEVAEVQSQPEQVAIVTEESSGEAKSGGDARIVGIYLGKINERVQISKVNPRSQQTGSVVLKFTIGTDGSLLSKQVASSSGSRVLDDAALAAIAHAAPFPAIPAEVSVEPMTFTQLFKFVIR